jgi:hypothetical protein
MTRFIAFLLPLFLCVSCVENLPAPGPTVTGMGITRVKVHAESAKQHVQAVVPDVSKENRVHLEYAEKHLDGVLEGADEAQRGNTKAIELISKMAPENAVLKSTIEAYKKRWFGDRMFFWGRVIAAGAIALWFAAGMVGAWLAPLPIGRFLLNLIPFSNIFASIARRK